MSILSFKDYGGKKNSYPKFLACWSAFYAMFLLSNVIMFFKKYSLANFHAYADLFINYEGGFVRRGLLGQGLLLCYRMGGNPVTIATILSFVAYIIITIYMIRNFAKRKYALGLLTVSYLLGAFGLYGIPVMRRDYMVLCSFLLILWLWRKMQLSHWLIIGNILACLTILCYEPFVFFSVPLFILITKLKTRSLGKSIIYWTLPILTFGLCCLYAGGKETYAAIKESTRPFLQSPGVMDFLARDTSGIMQYHLTTNFLQIDHGIPVVLLSMISILSMIYFNVNSTILFGGKAEEPNKRRHLLLIIIYLFICLSPMFTCLSTDYGRTCVYISICTFGMYFTLTPQELNLLFSNRLNQIADKTLAFIDHYVPPTQGKIMFIMLFIGIASWTGIGLRGFLISSQVGHYIYTFLLHLIG